LVLLFFFFFSLLLFRDLPTPAWQRGTELLQDREQRRKKEEKRRGPHGMVGMEDGVMAAGCARTT
jgi:hypothetical protein